MKVRLRLSFPKRFALLWQAFIAIFTGKILLELDLPSKAPPEPSTEMWKDSKALWKAADELWAAADRLFDRAEVLFKNSKRGTK